MQKLPLLFLILLLSACSTPDEQPYNPPILSTIPTSAPTATPLTDDIQRRVEGELAYALDNAPFVKQDTGQEIISYYQLSGLSTGELRTMVFDGYTLDVLDVYLRMTPGPIRVPLIVGIAGGETYTSLVLGLQDVPRGELLAKLEELYPQWQRLRIMLVGDFVTSTGADWDACTGDFSALRLTLNPSYCAVGQSLEDAYYEEMLLLRIQALGEVPNGFALPWFLLPPIETAPTPTPGGSYLP